MRRVDQKVDPLSGELFIHRVYDPPPTVEEDEGKEEGVEEEEEERDEGEEEGEKDKKVRDEFEEDLVSFHTHACMYMYMYMHIIKNIVMMGPDKPAIPGQWLFQV